MGRVMMNIVGKGTIKMTPWGSQEDSKEGKCPQFTVDSGELDDQEELHYLGGDELSDRHM
jgi:hypothetical protein